VHILVSCSGFLDQRRHFRGKNIPLLSAPFAAKESATAVTAAAIQGQGIGN
jgi:hypothetical protein